MIQVWLAKLVITEIVKALKKTPDKVLASSHEKRIKKLESMAHPRADFVCLKCGCGAKRKEKPTAKKRKK